MEIRERTTTYSVRDIELTFNEKYMVDDQGIEIFNRDIELENEIIIYNLYKKEKGLLTTEEVVNLRKKYGLNQKYFALALGMGEVSINRIERGTIQTQATDNLIRSIEYPRIMKTYLLQNKDRFNEEVFYSTLKLINEQLEYQNRRVLDYSIQDFQDLEFNTEDVFLVSEAIIYKYNSKIEQELMISEGDESNDSSEIESLKITNLVLQKLLYFVQGASAAIYGRPAFKEKIKAWNLGPVVGEVYYHYKKKPIPIIEFSEDSISEGLNRILDLVVEAYAKYSPYELVHITHNELPYKKTAHNSEIKFEEIKDYYQKIYPNH